MNALNPEEIAAGLDEFKHVPDDVLWEIVTRNGSCMSLYQLDLEPEWTGNARTDRELAARICAECPVRRECLELELRTSGDQTLGVWGALPADDVRAVYPVWLARRGLRAEQDGGQQ
jgi:WhiB family redox-sensing transcriptional regulator